jgi:hypothetical protein
MAGILETLYPQGDYLNIKANAPTRRDYNIQVNADLARNLPGGLLKDVVAPAAAATLSLPYDAIQAYQRMKPGTGIKGYYDAFMAEDPFSSLGQRFVGASAPLAERLANLNLSKISDLFISPAGAAEVMPKTVQKENPVNFSFTDYLQGKYDTNQGIDSFNNLVSDTVMAEPQIAQTEPAARNNQADILQIINQMEEEKKNYYTQPEEQPDFVDKVVGGLQKAAQYYGGSQIGAGIGSFFGPAGILIGALTGGKFLGGADTSMTPTDKYNLSTYGGYGPMGVQDKYGINTVSLFGDYDKYVQNWNQKYGNRVYQTAAMQAKQAEMARREREQQANIEQQFADIRQQSESSGGYNPSTGYTAETYSDLAGTGPGGSISSTF